MTNGNMAARSIQSLFTFSILCYRAPVVGWMTLTSTYVVLLASYKADLLLPHRLLREVCSNSKGTDLRFGLASHFSERLLSF